MATSTHLGITLVEQSQSQKEVTVNQAFTRIDAILNTGAKSKTVNTPPGSPVSGDLYIVGSSPTGAWAGQAGKLAYYDQIWRFITPNEGMSLWVDDEDLIYSYTGSSWVGSIFGETNTASNLGSGAGVYGAKVGQDLRFKSLVAGYNVAMSSTSNDITISAPGPEIDVRQYGAVPDARKVSDIVTTSGSATATSATAVFVGGDAGKPIKIYDAVNNVYIFRGTIQAVVNSTTITLSGTASASCSSGNGIAYWGSDNASAIQSALNAAASMVANDYSGAVHLPGRGKIKVALPIDSRGSGYLFNTTLTMARNVGIDAQATLFGNTGNGVNDRSWAIDAESGAFIDNLTLVVGGGMGIRLGTNATTHARSYVHNLQIWNVGLNYNGSLSPNSQTGLLLRGYDFSINRFWCRSGGIAFHINQASDVFCNHAVIVGASTAMQLNNAEDIRVAQAVFDTCSYAGLTIDSSRNCRIDADAHSTSGLALTYGLLVGEFDAVNTNRNLNITYAAQRTGGTMLKLSNSEDCNFNLAGSNAAMYSGGGSAISTCVQYGSGNSGNMTIFLSRDASISALSSGTTFGALISTTDGALSMDSSLDGFRASYNTQSGTSYTITASDCGKILRFTNASSVTLTLPNSLPVGFNCSVMQGAAGQVIFSPASGATRRNRQSHTKSAGQWAVCTLQVVTNSGGSSAEYVLNGDTVA